MHVQRISSHRTGMLCIAIAALAACSPPAPGPQSMRTPDHDIVAAIRAAGNSDSSVVQIAPLRDPAIDGFLDAARAAERAGDITTAISKTDSALGLAPEAPDILQYRAELAVRAKDYATAENDAHRSYSLGPKVGGLCAKNWQTVLEIEQLKGSAQAVQNARAERDKCQVPGPIRM